MMIDQAYILTNITLATMDPQETAPYGLLQLAEIVVKNGTIAWRGVVGELPAEFETLPRHDMACRLITPALIDCHTHIVAGGNRAKEFEMRLQGASYEEIARAGGGIVSSVMATRAASEEELLRDALPRIDALIAEGACLIEVKSGYGLDIDTELKMLRVARRIGQVRSIRIRTSFLGAHAVPVEFKDNADGYIEQVCIPALRAAYQEGLVDAVDGFCESIAFSPTQIARVFDVAKELGLPVKLHAEQLSNLGGAILAASYGALSVDHVEYLDEDGVRAIAASNTVAVVLPAAFYTLRETQIPPINSLRRAGVAMAIATDCNPGSSPISSLLLSMNMACTLFRITPEEALAGVTRNAALALGITDSGMIRKGMRADMAIWNVQHPAELSYRIGFNALEKRMFEGEL